MGVLRSPRAASWASECLSPATRESIRVKRFSSLSCLLLIGCALVSAIVLSCSSKNAVSPIGSDDADSISSHMTRGPIIKLPAGVDVQFKNVTQAAGIDFTHFDGRTDMQYIMDQTGSGVAWLDYDQDGLMDLFLVQGSSFEPPFPSPAPTCKLYHNLGNGRFRDVTLEVGLDHVGCGQGVAVGDIDNDGFPDLFLTCYGKPNVLYHNVKGKDGKRRFEDITVAAGLGDHPSWHLHFNYSTSAAFLDYNNDGHLDLFVCSYVKVDLDLKNNYPKCLDRKMKRDACAPTAFDGTRCVLYRNNGDLTFTNVSKEAGIDVPNAKGLGVVALDLDDDGLIDIFVANDMVPNFLFRNLGNGKFESVGPKSGCAVNLAGNPQAYMGVDADDLDGDGLPDLFSTAFSRETNTLFKNLGRCRFLDMTHGSGLGPPSWPLVGFGTCFLDLDHDGSQDIVVVNGHVSRNVDEDGNPSNTFRQKAQVYLNDGKGRFQHISSVAGPYFQEAHVGRGLAACDYDNDGHVDLAVNNSGERAVLLHNESTTPYHWLRLELRGTKSNRDAVGAKVTAHIGERRIIRHRKGGGSYCSASDSRLHFGTGAATTVDQVEIRWPSGLVQKMGPLAADRGYLIIEGDAKPHDPNETRK
jgi:enediyne biosynthesis protein E4